MGVSTSLRPTLDDNAVRTLNDLIGRVTPQNPTPANSLTKDVADLAQLIAGQQVQAQLVAANRQLHVARALANLNRDLGQLQAQQRHFDALPPPGVDLDPDPNANPVADDNRERAKRTVLGFFSAAEIELREIAAALVDSGVDMCQQVGGNQLFAFLEVAVGRCERGRRLLYDE